MRERVEREGGERGWRERGGEREGEGGGGRGETEHISCSRCRMME